MADGGGGGDKPAGPVRARRRTECPGSPREVLKSTLGAVGSAEHAAAAAGAAEVLKLRPLRDLWTTARDATEEERRVRWWAAEDATRRYLRPPAPTKQLDIAGAIDRAVAAAARCGECGLVFEEEGVRYVGPAKCKARVCRPCLRKRLRPVMDRWAPLWRAPLRPGFRRAFVTIGNREPVTDRAELRRYARRLGVLFRAMREGDARFAIAPRTWVAGLRALEIVPRATGGFGHAHLMVICRERYPWGLPTRNLPPSPTREQLGTRALLRHIGIGEVFRDDTLTDDGKGAEHYMRKIEAYMRKIEGGEQDGDEPADVSALTWAGRRDIQAMMRGARLVEAFGDARGLLGGPDRMHREDTAGGRRRAPLELLGLFDPAAAETWHLLPGGVGHEDGPEVTVATETVYRADTMARWAEWCDVDGLRRLVLT